MRLEFQNKKMVCRGSQEGIGDHCAGLAISTRSWVGSSNCLGSIGSCNTAGNSGVLKKWAFSVLVDPRVPAT